MLPPGICTQNHANRAVAAEMAMQERWPSQYIERVLNMPGAETLSLVIKKKKKK
jgi:hypothetical protein